MGASRRGLRLGNPASREPSPAPDADAKPDDADDERGHDADVGVPVHVAHDDEGEPVELHQPVDRRPHHDVVAVERLADRRFSRRRLAGNRLVIVAAAERAAAPGALSDLPGWPFSQPA